MNTGRQRGVALAIILWFLAGMSLMVLGITYIARMDTRMAQLHLARATAASAGDGAILLMLATVSARDPAQLTAGALLEEFSVGEHTVSVVMVPTGELINLNTAPAAVLARLFAARMAISASEAQVLAVNMVQWRKNTGPNRSGSVGGRFQSPEDVLQVEGMTRALWDAVRDAVVVSGGSTGSSMGPFASPAALESPAGQSLQDLDGADTGQPAGGLARSYRVDALIETRGRTWLRRRWVDFGGASVSDLPWRFSRIEAPRVVPGQVPG